MTKHNYLFSALTVLFLGIAFQANAIDRQSLAQYAASLKGKKGASLKIALQPLLKPKTTLAYGKGKGHTWSGFYRTDRNPKNNECYNRYSSEKFFFTSSTSSISGMNIEHSFPKSWWGGAKNDAYKDLYHLYPSPSTGNSDKSNYPMDEVTNASIEEEGYDKIGTGKNVNSRAWEPGDRFKGDFARTYMYMAVAYGDLTFSEDGLKTMNNEAYPGLKPWASALYRKWSSADKVDSLERARNNAVALIEGNRNLFIDYPYLDEYVWGDSVDVAFDPTTSISTASDDDRYLQGGSYPDEPTTPDVPVDDDVYYFSLADHVVSDSLYLIVADNGGSLLAMQMLTGTKTYGYPGTVGVKMVNDTISLSSLENTFKITADGKIVDSKGRYVWHEGSYKTISMTAAGNSKGSWTITKNSDGTFKIAFADNYYIQYSTEHKSYGCYLDAQGLMPKLFVRVNKNATPTAIVSVVDSRQDYNGNIYTIQGRLVGKDASTLAPGLYIKDGKKFVVR